MVHKRIYRTNSPLFRIDEKKWCWLEEFREWAQMILAALRGHEFNLGVRWLVYPLSGVCLMSQEKLCPVFWDVNEATVPLYQD